MEQITLDMIPNSRTPIAHISQYDSGRHIRFNLQNITLTGSEAVTLKIRKTDGELVSKTIENHTSYVEYVSEKADCDVSGKANCEIVISKDDVVIGSKNFILNVEVDPYDGAGVVTKTASGRIATFETNIADVLQSVKCEINAKQDLHGFDSPWIDSDKVNKAPYLSRALAGTAERIGNYEYNKLVGGTYAFNQLLNKTKLMPSGTALNLTITNNNDGSLSFIGTANATDWILLTPEYLSVITGHKYLIDNNNNEDLKISTGYSGEQNIINWTHTGALGLYVKPQNNTFYNLTLFIQVIDLTQMFGATIADYIYSLEQANTGAGVAYFRALFSADYYPYNAGELISVKPTAHITRDGNNNIISNTALDPDIELRGIPKLDVNNKLYYDGDTYSADGSVSRKYGIVDLGSLNWIYTSGDHSRFETTTVLPNAKIVAGNIIPNALCSIYKMESMNNVYLHSEDKILGFDNYVWVYDSSAGTDANAFKTAMSGKYLVYELASTTTETADAFTNPQAIDSNGSEEFTDSRSVSIPVGHESYYANICDIVGHSELNLTRCGKNFVALNASPYQSAVNTGVSVNSESTDLLSITSSAVAYACRQLYYKLPAGTYTVSLGETTKTGTETPVVSIYDYPNGTLIVNALSANNNVVFTLSDETVLDIRLFATGNTAEVNTVTFSDFQIELGSTATAYEPYNGTPYLVQFGQTIYGGVYDKSGRMTITWAGVDMSSLTWQVIEYMGISYKVSNSLASTIKAPTALSETANIKCSIFKNVSRDELDNFNHVICVDPNKNIDIIDNDYSTAADFTTAMSGIILAYELATPIVVDNLPAIPVFAENGVNNIFHDGNGDTEVKYLYIA